MRGKGYRIIERFFREREAEMGWNSTVAAHPLVRHISRDCGLACAVRKRDEEAANRRKRELADELRRQTCEAKNKLLIDSGMVLFKYDCK